MSSKQLPKWVQQLRKSDDPSIRDAAAAEVGMFFERALINSNPIEKNAFRLAADSLLTATLREIDPLVRETMLDALVNASAVASRWGEMIDFNPLVSVIEIFSQPELEYLLLILGFTRNPRYVPTIERYLNHSNCEIRKVAEEALIELGLRSLPVHQVAAHPNASRLINNQSPLSTDTNPVVGQ